MTNRYIVIYSEQSNSSLIIEEVAKLAKCSVICCTTPEQTLSVALTTQPSLIIILSISPIINGASLIADIRSTVKPRPTIFVIAWQQSEQIILSLLEEGVDQYLTFPICLNRLYGKISSSLKGC